MLKLMTITVVLFMPKIVMLGSEEKALYKAYQLVYVRSNRFDMKSTFALISTDH